MLDSGYLNYMHISSGISSVTQQILIQTPFLLTFLCRTSSLTNFTSSSFFLLSLVLIVVQYKFPWLPECFHPYEDIPSRKGKYPMMRTNTKPYQLTKHAKISYSIVPIVFHKFSCRTYRNGLNKVPQSWGIPSISKSTKRVSSIPFEGESAF